MSWRKIEEVLVGYFRSRGVYIEDNDGAPYINIDLDVCLADDIDHVVIGVSLTEVARIIASEVRP